MAHLVASAGGYSNSPTQWTGRQCCQLGVLRDRARHSGGVRYSRRQRRPHGRTTAKMGAGGQGEAGRGQGNPAPRETSDGGRRSCGQGVLGGAPECGRALEEQRPRVGASRADGRGLSREGTKGGGEEARTAERASLGTLGPEAGAAGLHPGPIGWWCSAQEAPAWPPPACKVPQGIR